MVVVVIIAILASLAIPSYREYVIRGHRRAAQAEMAAIATRELQYFAANRAFADDVPTWLHAAAGGQRVLQLYGHARAERQRAVVYDHLHGHRLPGKPMAIFRSTAKA